MRYLRRMFSVIIGTFFLVIAAAVLWTAHRPQPTDEVTTGGVGYTQSQLAAGEAVTAAADIELGEGPALVPVAPELSAEAASDLATLDTAEAAAAPNTITPLAPLAAAPLTEAAPPSGAPVESAQTISMTSSVVLDGESDVTVAPIGTDGPAAPDGQGGATGTAAGYEQRVVELEWPSEFQVGRAGSIRIKLKMMDSGALQPVAEIEDNEILATPILIDASRYANYNAFVTSVLSAPDFSVQATSPLRQPLPAGGEAEWRYTLESGSAQSSVISVGLNISWDDKVSGTPSGPQNVPIFGQALQVDVNYVFGLITVPQASIAGTALAIVGFIAEAPLLAAVLETVWDVIFGGDRKQRRREKEEQQRRQSRRRRR